MNTKIVESTATNMGKAIIARILPGTDLSEGIETICRKHEIISGCVVSGVGSLKHATFVYIAADPQAPNGAAYVSPKTVKGPLELMSLQGTIGLTENHDICIHLHGMMIDSESRPCGGHLISSGNPVLITAEVMIYGTHDVSVVKALDHRTGFELFNLKYP